jgi:hypothetical protein
VVCVGGTESGERRSRFKAQSSEDLDFFSRAIYNEDIVSLNEDFAFKKTQVPQESVKSFKKAIYALQSFAR